MSPTTDVNGEGVGDRPRAESPWLLLGSTPGKYPPAWRKGIPQKIMVKWAGRQCENCQAPAGSSLLHVHHLTWDAKHDCRFENLLVCCVKCHTALHNRGWQPGFPWNVERWGPVPPWLTLRNLPLAPAPADALAEVDQRVSYIVESQVW